MSTLIETAIATVKLGGVSRLCGLNYCFLEYAQSKVRRQIFLPSFSSERLTTYIDSISRQSERLAEALAPYAGKGPFHIVRILGGFCFDNVIEAAGVEELKEEFNSEKAQEIRRNKLASFNALKSKDENNKGESIKPGLFDSLVNSNLSKREISEEMLVMFGASDEAGIVVYFTLKLLGLYPSVQEKVYEELIDIFGKSERPLVKDDMMKMRYLDMVIKEALRLFPPVPFVLRTAQTETKLSSGNIIPAGAGIGIAIYSLHRHPAYWGPDAEHFDPERFLPERLAAVPDTAYMPFSYGPRSCPGYKFAQNIAKIGLCSILRRYKVVDTPAAGPVPHIKTKFEITMRPVDDSIELVYRTKKYREFVV